MVVHGLLREEQLRRDLGVRRPFGEQSQDVELAAGEPGGVGRRLLIGTAADVAGATCAQPPRDDLGGRRSPEALDRMGDVYGGEAPSPTDSAE